jgi:hypothetical protein
MFERYALENKLAASAAKRSDADAATIKRLQGQFGKWHGVSSLINLVVLCASLSHAWTLAGRLALVGV